MSDKCEPRLTAECEEQVIVSAKDEGECPQWEMCLPFGGKMWSNGKCVQIEKGDPPADGTYGKVVIKDGCLVGVEAENAPLYTANHCANVPCSCSDSGSGSCSVSTTAGNLITEDASGSLLAKLYTGTSGDISFSGAGTSDDPLNASVSASGLSTTVQANAPLSVSKDGNTYTLSHRTGAAAQVISGMSFDEYGHLTNYSKPTDPTSSYIKAVTTVEGITATTTDGVVQLTIDTTQFTAHDVQLGEYRVNVDGAGRVTNISQNSYATHGVSAVFSSSSGATLSFLYGGYEGDIHVMIASTSPLPSDIAVTLDDKSKLIDKFMLPSYIPLSVKIKSNSSSSGSDSEEQEYEITYSTVYYKCEFLVDSNIGSGQHTISITSASGFTGKYKIVVQFTRIVA